MSEFPGTPEGLLAHVARTALGAGGCSDAWWAGLSGAAPLEGHEMTALRCKSFCAAVPPLRVPSGQYLGMCVPMHFSQACRERCSTQLYLL